MLENTVVHADMAELAQDLEGEIRRRTWGRVRHLKVRVTDSQVHIRGFCPSYYDKQLTLHSVLDRAASMAVVLDVEVLERTKSSVWNDELCATVP